MGKQVKKFKKKNKQKNKKNRNNGKQLYLKCVVHDDISQLVEWQITSVQ